MFHIPGISDSEIAHVEGGDSYSDCLNLAKTNATWAQLNTHSLQVRRPDYSAQADLAVLRRRGLRQPGRRAGLGLPRHALGRLRSRRSRRRRRLVLRLGLPLARSRRPLARLDLDWPDGDRCFRPRRAFADGALAHSSASADVCRSPSAVSRTTTTGSASCPRSCESLTVSSCEAPRPTA